MTIDIVSAWCSAYVFGRTSAKIRTNIVMTSVAYTTPASPKILIKTLVASADAKMFTRLLPSSNAPIMRSFFSRILLTRLARLSPSCSNACKRTRDAAVRAVSEPEKNPDKTNRMKIAAIAMISVSSMLLIMHVRLILASLLSHR